jgi:hypothetical protein
MPGAELLTGACDGNVVVTLCGELHVTGAAEAEAAIATLVVRGQPPVRRLLAPTGNDEMFWVQVSVDAAVTGIASRRRRYCWRRLAVRTARPGRAAPSRTGTG